MTINTQTTKVISFRNITQYYVSCSRKNVAVVEKVSNVKTFVALLLLR